MSQSVHVVMRAGGGVRRDSHAVIRSSGHAWPQPKMTCDPPTAWTNQASLSRL